MTELDIFLIHLNSCHENNIFWVLVISLRVLSVTSQLPNPAVLLMEKSTIYTSGAAARPQNIKKKWNDAIVYQILVNIKFIVPSGKQTRDLFTLR